MPLTAKGETIKAAMEKQYGSEKGEEVFYRSKNAGTISGVDAAMPVSAEPVVMMGSVTATAPSGLTTGIRDLARRAGAQ